MLQEIYILDLLGTFAFAVYGSYFALKKDFDLFGVFVAAFLSGVGGGTICDIIFNNTPFYFYDMNYIAVIAFAVIFTLLIYKNFHKLKTFALILDSVGLVTFSFIGASKADELGLGIFAITFIATLTAVGGGVLRDIILNRTPHVMYYDFYASIAILLGLVYGVFREEMHNPLWANLLMFFCFVIRILVIVYKVNLWKPKGE